MNTRPPPLLVMKFRSCKIALAGLAGESHGRPRDRPRLARSTTGCAMVSLFNCEGGTVPLVEPALTLLPLTFWRLAVTGPIFYPD